MDEYRDVGRQIKQLEQAMKKGDKSALLEAIESASLALELRETNMMIGILSPDDKPTKELQTLLEQARAAALKP